MAQTSPESFMKPRAMPLTAQLLIFHVHLLVANVIGQKCHYQVENANADVAASPGQTSCLIQQRADTGKAVIEPKESPFSPAQWQCISQYGASVDADLPGFARRLEQRRFGGTGKASADGSVILGAGFGTTATRSLAAFARQLGLAVHHCKQGKREDIPEFWMRLLNITSMQHPNGLDGCLSTVDAMNFSEAFDQGNDLLLDTPMAEHFLDFYAVSPQSKVILTNRNAVDWVKARLQWDETMAAPLHSPCGMKLAPMTPETAKRLYEAHNRLVRCIVPAEKLTEINVFDGSPLDVPALSDFLGKGRPEFPPLFPRVSDQRWGDEAKQDFAICITGQIRRLELKTKVERLVRPLMERNFRVVVALVLDPRATASYIHRGSGEEFDDFVVVDGNFSSLQQAAEMFPSGITLLGDAFIPRDYPVDARYAEDLYSQSPEMGFEYAGHRAQSHMRQWEALERCGQLLISPVSHANYTLRLRDDSAILEPFVPRLDLLDESGVYAPACSSFGGVNDKFALIVGRGIARHYFALSLDMVRHRFDEIHQLMVSSVPRRCNPEHALKIMFDLSQTKIKTLEPDNVPVVPSKNLRRDGKTYQCIYTLNDDYNDCIPERSRVRITDIQGGFSVRKTGSTRARPDFLCEGTELGF
ncbi:hypothetical protein AK812_SmicGene4849 [Symbiodinium microadriaticum]|uniref:Uncharacterized protein n=1 Tax=Symbiodinium microadriaticum TaxID=2951 RepID=A0A1Q9EV49_SYMMI|nr:hypothetical protein AK812_SmicGene4849 [Symbiodinium microadriaticum]